MQAICKYIVVWFCLQFTSAFLFAQSKIDSLKTALVQSTNDTDRLIQTFEIGEQYWFMRNVPAAVSYLRQAVQMAETYNYYPHQINALNLLANSKLKLEQYDSVFYYLQTAVTKAAQRKDTAFLPLVYETYHHVYYQLGDYNTALHYALQSADGYERSNNPAINRQAIFAYISVGQVFRQLGQLDKALHYFEKALASGQKAAQPAYNSDALLNIANVYETQGRLRQAQQLYDSVIRLDKEHYNHESSLFAYAGLGQIALQQKKYAESATYLKTALKYAQEANQEFYIDDLLAQLGKASFLAKDTGATGYFNEAVKLATESKDMRSLYTTYSYLAEMEKMHGDFKKSLAYQEVSQQYKDSLITAEKVRFTNNLEVLHRTQQKEAQIQQLQASQANTQLTLLQRNRLLWIAGSLLLVVLVFFVLYYRNSRHKQLLVQQQQQLQTEKIKALESESKLEALQNLVKGQEMERTRIARDLHDSVGSLLSIILFRFSSLRGRFGALQQNELFESTVQLADETLREVRRISHNLAPEALIKLGLKEAILEFCSKAQAHASLKFTVQLYGLEERLPLVLETNLFAMVQELLQNVIKHSQASEVIVQINRIDNQLTLTVEDNGTGFDVAALHQTKSLGLTAIRNRVLSLNGDFTLDSAAGVGTTAIITIPVRTAA